MAKLGDSKPCPVCGGIAILRIVQPSLGTLGWVDDCSMPYDIPLIPMWQCDDCDDTQPAAQDVEA